MTIIIILRYIFQVAAAKRQLCSFSNKELGGIKKAIVIVSQFSKRYSLGYLNMLIKSKLYLNSKWEKNKLILLRKGADAVCLQNENGCYNGHGVLQNKKSVRI